LGLAQTLHEFYSQINQIFIKYKTIISQLIV